LRAYADALAAINASIRQLYGVPFSDSDRSCRTDAHAGHAPVATISVESQ
jgi:hypothetical protein